MREFEKLYTGMEYIGVPAEFKDNSGIEITNQVMKEMLDKSDVSFWVHMNSNYNINKLSSMLTVLYISMNHRSQDDIMTFSCIDPKKSFYTKLNSQEIDIITFQQHRHDFFELMFILDGELEIVIENVCNRYRRGDICLINCNILHKEDYSNDYQAVYLCLTKEYLEIWSEEERAELGNGRISRFIKENLDGKARNAKNYLDFIYLGDDSSSEILQAEQELLSISNELIEHRPGYKAMIRGRTIRLFCIMQDTKIYASNYIRLDSVAEGSLFEAAVDYMEENKRRIIRNELSAALHYNGDYINQIFMKRTGESLHDYNLNVCLREAKHLLSSTSMSVSDVIKRLGFENRTSFYQQFLKRFGMTPMEYRQQNIIHK